MIEKALEIELHEEEREAEFLVAYDRIVRAVNERYDVRGSDLSFLVRSCLENDNRLSNDRRKQFAGRMLPGVFDLIEAEARAAPSAAEPEEPDQDFTDEKPE